MHLTTVHRQACMEAEKDSGGLEELYRAQWAPMVRLAWLMGGRRDEAEDIVHDAFVQLEPRWSSVTNPAAYLRQTVVNGVRTRQRRDGMERRYHFWQAEHSIDPADYEDLGAIVDELPDRQRHVLVLRYYLDLTLAEIAELLGCPVGTVKSLIHRGLANVREKVNQ